MTKLEFKRTISRARDTYGYNICSLWVDGKKVSSCNGGGYDMKGTALGDWIASAYADRLMKLKAEDMPERSHWERAENPRKICDDINCAIKHATVNGDGEKELAAFPGDTTECPHCHGPVRTDYHDGKRVDDGRFFYGLSFANPNFDPGKAVIGEGCDDRTFGLNSKGKTVEEAEAAGLSVGLERCQAFHKATSKVGTEKHTVPMIDGGCGFSSVENIMKAIGLSLKYVNKSKAEVYTLVDEYAAPKLELA